MVLSPAVCERFWNWKGDEVCDLWSHAVHVLGPPLRHRVCAEVATNRKHGDRTAGDAYGPSRCSLPPRPQGCPRSRWQGHPCTAPSGGTRIDAVLAESPGRETSRQTLEGRQGNGFA